MIRVITNDNPSANNIHPRFGQTKALGQSSPSRTNNEPTGSVIGETLANFPRYSHQLLRRTRIPPTNSPNSRSRRKDLFFMVLF